MRRIELATFAADAARLRKPHHDAYYAMYSSVLEGITTDPVLMVLSIDDHLVHRGDGVFETFKCVNGNIYNLQAHLDRLACSAAAIELEQPCSRERLTEIVVETAAAGGARDCTIRIFVSRGCGSFGVNPYDCGGANLYVLVTSLATPFMQKHGRGAIVCSSKYATKPADMATIKSCNYLTNALMQKEAIDRGVDFTVSFSKDGILGESSTANIGIVTAKRELLFPKLDGIVSGTTMLRISELASALVSDGRLSRIAFEDIPRSALTDAEEILLVGTSINVLAVVEFDGKAVGGEGGGPVCRHLGDLLEADIAANGDLHTMVSCGA